MGWKEFIIIAMTMTDGVCDRVGYNKESQSQSLYSLVITRRLIYGYNDS